MKEREARQARRQIKRMADGRTVGLVNYRAIETGAHGTRTEKTPESPHIIPAVPDPGADNIFDGDFGVDVSYDIAFLIAESDIPEDVSDGGGEETASEVEYGSETYRLETVNTRFPSGFAILGCTAGDEV